MVRAEDMGHPGDMGRPEDMGTSPLGAHIKVGGGLGRTGIASIEKAGAETVQVFLGNPRGWATPAGSPAEDAKFREYCAERRIPTFVHAPYLVNLGSPTPETAERSVVAVRHALRRGIEIGAQGVVVHTGSAVATGDPVTLRRDALAQVRRLLLPVLDEMDPAGPLLLLEPTAGQGQSLCAAVEDLGPYLEALDDSPRVAVCFDTCHAFAAGHDLAVPGGMTSTLDALVKQVGVERVRLIHVNDSKDGVGEAKDRHENLGRGRIGADAFAELLAHGPLRGVPMVVETPGTDEDRAADVAFLQEIRSHGEPPRAD